MKNESDNCLHFLSVLNARKMRRNETLAQHFIISGNKTWNLTSLWSVCVLIFMNNFHWRFYILASQQTIETLLSFSLNSAVELTVTPGIFFSINIIHTTTIKRNAQCARVRKRTKIVNAHWLDTDPSATKLCAQCFEYAVRRPSTYRRARCIAFLIDTLSWIRKRGECNRSRSKIISIEIEPLNSTHIIGVPGSLSVIPIDHLFAERARLIIHNKCINALMHHAPSKVNITFIGLFNIFLVSS